MTVTRPDVAEAVVEALAAEARCHPRLLAEGGVHVSEISPSGDVNLARRKFPQREFSLEMTTMGAGVVIPVTHQWAPRVRDLFRNADPSDAFSLSRLGEMSTMVSDYSYQLHGPVLYHVTSGKDWKAREVPDGYALRVGGEELLESLKHVDWPNAMAPGASAQGRPIAVAAIAMHRDVVVGVAAATADSATLWQIGVDVPPAHRGRGLGPLLTSAAAEAVLRRDRVPYYGTAADNIASRRTAQSAGFYPCWTSVYTTGPVA